MYAFSPYLAHFSVSVSFSLVSQQSRISVTCFILFFRLLLLYARLLNTWTNTVEREWNILGYVLLLVCETLVYFSPHAVKSSKVCPKTLHTHVALALCCHYSHSVPFALSFTVFLLMYFLSNVWRRHAFLVLRAACLFWYFCIVCQ